ncbi:hypothetical protein HPB49_002077 [Dermacentor silvarum]|uniref:Uncharacterized protein n=1 Tax=Dermacentor silvarum TaxID=543639 RepID=A0ACB8D218_DERSI|nr:hypothetical protein HPB49_002077 [Dermacentor silvarum]
MRALHDRRGGAGGAAAMASSTTTTTAQTSAPPASGGGGGGCTPHLKRVLKSYQASAVSSLQGPPALMAASAAADPGGLADEDEPLEAPALPAIQQPPLLTPPDQAQGSERDETQLEWNTISCFTVGGEQRLCLPQILNTVLTDLSLPQINSVCDELHIFCLRCNPEQLDVLKRAGVIPTSAPSCGLITKSDAERLCAALLHAGTPAPADLNNPGPMVVVPVYHECFGGASGVLWLEAAMVRCRECGLLYSPRRFVCHGHGSRERRTCHWGFDSGRWRNYLLLDDREPLEDADAMRALLRQFKDKFPDAAKRKQHIVVRESGGTRRSRRGGTARCSVAGGKAGFEQALSSAVSAVSVPVLWQLCAFIDPSPGLCLLPRRRQKAAATSNTAVLDWRRDVVIARVGRAKASSMSVDFSVPPSPLFLFTAALGRSVGGGHATGVGEAAPRAVRFASHGRGRAVCCLGGVKQTTLLKIEQCLLLVWCEADDRADDGQHASAPAVAAGGSSRLVDSSPLFVLACCVSRLPPSSSRIVPPRPPSSYSFCCRPSFYEPCLVVPAPRFGP